MNTNHQMSVRFVPEVRFGPVAKMANALALQARDFAGSSPAGSTKLNNIKMTLKHDLKTIVKGRADLNCVKSGGIAVYYITVEDGTVYSLDIDLSDKHDVGETATFMAHYDKSIILMRWIRRAIEKEELYQVSI